MDLNPFWERNTCSATPEITQHFKDPKVHYCVHKNLQLVPMPSHMNTVHTKQYSIILIVCVNGSNDNNKQ
jgi:hypothetical protein